VTIARLVQVFGEAAGVAPADPAKLGAKLAAHLAGGRASWPNVALEPETFVAHLARHAGKTAAPETFVDTVHGTDLYLAWGVCQRDKAALTYFEERFMAQVPLFVLRVRVGRDVVDEVQQKLRESLLLGVSPSGRGAAAEDAPHPKIADYSGRGPLGGWLRMAAVRTALNHVRSPCASFEPLQQELSSCSDPELAYLQERAGREFAEAFGRVLGKLAPEDRAILRLHYLQGLTMDQLARAYKTPRSTIARRITRVREQIVTETEALLRVELRLSPSSIASVIRQARSQLQVTITRLLK
jgi:RNA polymerase sigma-70 factor (ECF subfamily)